jgi:hypothetical protein
MTIQQQASDPLCLVIYTDVISSRSCGVRASLAQHKSLQRKTDTLASFPEHVIHDVKCPCLTQAITIMVL